MRKIAGWDEGGQQPQTNGVSRWKGMKMKQNTNRMAVGHIPSLTWNKLKMNDGIVPDGLAFETAVTTSFRSLPEGMSHKKLTTAQAKKWLETNAPGEEPERFVAGKVPIYHPQTFGTGLGKEFDDFLEEADVPTHLLEVEDGRTIEEPIRWSVHLHDGNQTADAQIIHVGAGSHLTLIMDYGSDREAAGCAAISTKIVMERGAHLSLVKAQTLGKGFLHLDDLGVTMADDAALEITQMEIGAKDVFTGIQVEQIGQRADLQGKMGYMDIEDQTLDINYNVIQRGKKTNSFFTFDGVLADKAQKSFRGTIDFRNGSSGSAGDEQENVLLLDPDIVNKTLPIILCEEEDVEGRHGASVGRLAEDMLFYMASRGIDEKLAERIMVRARLSAVMRDIPDEALKKDLHDFIEEAFEDESVK